MSGPIIFAYALNGPRAGQALSGSDINEQLQSDALAWVHLDLNHPDARSWLQENLTYIDHHALDALLAEETRPRATEIAGGLLVNLRGVNLNEGADPEDMVSIRLWLDPHRIISLRRRRVRAAVDIEERIQNGTGPETAGQFIALLVERLATRAEPVLREIDDAADALEEDVVAHASPDLRRPITEIRRRTIQLRRYIGPQRDAVTAIRSSPLGWIDDQNRRRLTEAQDRLTRYVEDLDAIRERSQIVKDELTNARADRLNRNTYLLGVIAAIFLPLGFFTGLLGINVGGIPGTDNPAAFWIFTSGLVVVVAVQVVIFRLLKWF
ncbi:MAG: zinc transporter ZntB [Rhodobacter sp.]|nr:zinc transporter ZntB [Rhodobacter sp.]